MQSWPIGRARTPPARTGERRLSEKRARTTTPCPHAPSTAPWLAHARTSSKALLRASEQGGTRSVVGPARVGSLGGVSAGTLLIGPVVGRTWAEAVSFRTRPERIRGSVVAAVLGLSALRRSKYPAGSTFARAVSSSPLLNLLTTFGSKDKIRYNLKISRCRNVERDYSDLTRRRHPG